MSYSDGISVEHGEAHSPRIISSAASESSQRAEVYFVFIGVNAILPLRSRRLLDGLAGSSYLKREDAAIGWYLAPWMTSWLWVEIGAGPWRYGLTDWKKSGLLVTLPGRVDAFWG